MTALDDKLRTLKFRQYIAEAGDGDALSSLSKAVDFPIPDSFSAFLKSYPYTGVFDVEGDVCTFIPDLQRHRPVDMLFGACSDLRYDITSVAIEQRTYASDTFPDYMLQIGQDLGGNAVCIDLRTDKDGAIYYWNHEITPNGFTKVANNIDEFILGLDVMQPT